MLKTIFMHDQLQQNKDVVSRFNKEFIAGGNIHVFHELMSDHVINHAAAPGTPNGKESMRYFLQDILRPAFPDLTVHIHDQVAEGDKVVTRKEFHGTHDGAFFGIAPTGKQVVIHVIDIIRVQDGQYAEHWGMSNIDQVLKQLSEA